MRRSNRSSTVELRKGLWTGEEDNRLRNCIAQFGEGKWHLVPARAGLNRCRKSCRLRWLNYLKPDIKRGDFSSDEVDLMIRLHKLLGNRWSLIAGRLPGRTANDVKNYWNTNLLRKTASIRETMGAEKGKVAKSDSNRSRPVASSVAVPAVTVKPRPRPTLKNGYNNNKKEDLLMIDGIGRKLSAGVTHFQLDSPPSSIPSLSLQNDRDRIKYWWDNLVLDDTNTCPSSFGGDEGSASASLKITDNDITAGLMCTYPGKQLSKWVEVGEVAVEGGAAVVGDHDGCYSNQEDALFDTTSGLIAPDSDFWDLMLSADQYHHQEQLTATMVQ